MAALRILSSLFIITSFSPLLAYCQSTFTCSRATYYGSPDCMGTPRGACGYGEFGKTVNGGLVSAVGRLYRNGTGCGACYQVRCRKAELCDPEGVKIVVTDYGEGDNTDFILSHNGYQRMGRPDKVDKLISRGVIDVEYRRIACQYLGHNLMFKVDENSKFPDYLALVILFQGGLKDILTIELWQEDCKEWRRMRHPYGAEWDVIRPPPGDITIRLLASEADEQKWVLFKNVIPCEWKAGMIYDSGFQFY